VRDPGAWIRLGKASRLRVVPPGCVFVSPPRILMFDPALTTVVLRQLIAAVSSWLRRQARQLGIKGVLKNRRSGMPEKSDQPRWKRV
jgi:hypothetical protein